MMLYVMFVLSLLPLASAVRVELYANETIATFLDYYGVIFFQPEEPPASPMSCSEQSACDGCDSEMACGGSLPLDLSTGGDTLRFVWNAPEDQIIHITGDYTMEASWAGGGSGWITQGGDFGTELELRLDTPNCKAEYQDIDVNTDVTLDFDDGGIGHTQSYQLLKSSVDSFVELRAGCAIHMHMRFEPTNDGILDLKFKKLTITAIYDSQKTAQGEREYTWSTSGSMWIREPAGGSIELLGSIIDPTEAASTTTTDASTTVPPTTTSPDSSTVDPTEPAATTTTDASTTVPSATSTSPASSTVDPTETSATITTNTTTDASTSVPPTTSTSPESGFVPASTQSSSPQRFSTSASSLFLILASLVAAI
ncbi:hypothetical protein ACHAXM_002525 [Skeletonema potamos]